MSSLLIDSEHRLNLNMEVDLNSLFGFRVT
jgi:hypothetical protein